MAVQPDQDTRGPNNGPELPGEAERQRTDVRVVSVLGAIALTVAVGMWFYTKDKEMIAGDGTTVHHTTGTRSHDGGSRMTPRSAAPSLPASSASRPDTSPSVSEPKPSEASASETSPRLSETSPNLGEISPTLPQPSPRIQ
jgi:hypothetical protein